MLTTIHNMGSVMTLDGVVPICCSIGLSVPSEYRRVDTIGMVANPSMFSSPDTGTRGTGVAVCEETGAETDATVDAVGVDDGVVVGKVSAKSGAPNAD